jgi:hypothetical protein
VSFRIVLAFHYEQAHPSNTPLDLRKERRIHCDERKYCRFIGSGRYAAAIEAIMERYGKRLGHSYETGVAPPALDSKSHLFPALARFNFSSRLRGCCAGRPSHVYHGYKDFRFPSIWAAVKF